jgi:hypothetical protein
MQYSLGRIHEYEYDSKHVYHFHLNPQSLYTTGLPIAIVIVIAQCLVFASRAHDLDLEWLLTQLQF